MDATTLQTNWAGNLTYRASAWRRPGSVAEVQDLVACSERIGVIGTRHSFNGLADTGGVMLSLERLGGMVLDGQAGTVTVEAGVRYGELGEFLHRQGHALHNLASLPHISVVGACMTATHGSGDRLPCLAAAVTALDLVTAGGELLTLSREEHGEAFAGMVVSLGALGVVTRMTLALEETYHVRQEVYEHLPFPTAEVHLAALFAAAESVSLFTDWQEPRFHQVWLKRRVAAGSTAPLPTTHFGATAALADCHPLPGLPAAHCTPQQGVPGPWHERLPHFRLDHTPSQGEELQSEYFVPRAQAAAALRAVLALGNQFASLLLVSEVRTVAADDLWLSPAYRRDSLALHFTWRRDERAVRAVLPALEEALAPFGARPHWGKVFTLSPAHLTALYERLPDFRQLLERHDPGGKFRNPFLNRYIFGEAGVGPV